MIQSLRTLSEMIISGRPRTSAMASSSRATRMPDSDVSTTSARHSRVKSSTTTRTRNRLPSVSMADTKSRLQRWFRTLRQCHRRSCAQGPLAAAAFLHGQPFLAIETEQLLVVQVEALPPQQDVQPPIAEPTPFQRQFLQPLAHGGVVRPSGRIAEGLRGEPDQTAGTPLRITLLFDCPGHEALPCLGRQNFPNASFSVATSPQPSVLILKALQPTRIRHFHAAIGAAPVVEGSLRDPVLAAQFRRRDSRLVLLQHANDLVFREPALLNLRLLSTESSSNRGHPRGNVSDIDVILVVCKLSLSVAG